MQTIYLGYTSLDQVELLFNKMKKWVVEARQNAQDTGKEVPLTFSEYSAATHGGEIGKANSPSMGGAPLSMESDSFLPFSPGMLKNTQILDATSVRRIRACLPPRLLHADWELLYSTALDGVSIHTYVVPFLWSVIRNLL